jgi:hypothetical protein
MLVKPEEYDAITSAEWNNNKKQQECQSANWYTYDFSKSAEDPITRKVINGISQGFLNETNSPVHSLRCLYTTKLDLKESPAGGIEYSEILHEEALNSMRRYILIVHAPQCPGNTYVSYTDERYGECYYIKIDDNISKQNFLLVGQFLAMQAVPPQNLPLIPTIPVGANRGG